MDSTDSPIMNINTEATTNRQDPPEQFNKPNLNKQELKLYAQVLEKRMKKWPCVCRRIKNRNHQKTSINLNDKALQEKNMDNQMQEVKNILASLIETSNEAEKPANGKRQSEESIFQYKKPKARNGRSLQENVL